MSARWRVISFILHCSRGNLFSRVGKRQPACTHHINDRTDIAGGGGFFLFFFLGGARFFFFFFLRQVLLRVLGSVSVLLEAGPSAGLTGSWWRGCSTDRSMPRVETGGRCPMTRCRARKMLSSKEKMGHEKAPTDSALGVMMHESGGESGVQPWPTPPTDSTDGSFPGSCRIRRR